MPSNAAASTKRKPKRQRKKRRTDPDDISSPSSSSTSSSSSEDEESVNSRSKSAASANLKAESKNTAAKSSAEHVTETERNRKRKHDVPLPVAERPKPTQIQQSPPAADELPADSANGGNRDQDESDGSISHDSSRLLPPEHDPESDQAKPAMDAAKTQRDLDVDTAFENWYVRAVTAQYGNDLDKLRTEAADFKARPKEAVAVLSRALRQGASVFGEEDRRLVVGGLSEKDTSQRA